MIFEIQIQGEATFPKTHPISVKPLKKINFFYGANGSGKTTISRVANAPSDYPKCNLKWTNGVPMQVLTYNRDFIEREFEKNTSLKGVFTLGSGNIDALRKIEDKKTELVAALHKRAGQQVILDGKPDSPGAIASLQQVEDRFVEACWLQKQKHDEYFKLAFKGLRNNRMAFRDRVVIEHERGNTQYREAPSIQADALVLLTEPAPVETLLPEMPQNTELTKEQTDLLLLPILSSNDSRLSTLISRLRSSDWIQKGIDYLSESQGVCPFCQQTVSSQLAFEVESLFDSECKSAVDRIRFLCQEYKQTLDVTTYWLDDIAAAGTPKLDQARFMSASNGLKAAMNSNLQLLELKLSEPSRVLEPNDLTEWTSEIQFLITETNQKVSEHNSLVANFFDRRAKLIDEIWSYIVNVELQQAITMYKTDKHALESRIRSVSERMRQSEADIALIQNTISQLEVQIVSIEPSVNAINSILKSFGFKSFRLAVALDRISYDILREDGSSASASLSEGERTFLTFLYFYHLIKGSHYTSGMSQDRVVVIDDPISSLDSDVLFIVGTLIKRLISECDRGVANIRQILILTHNIYFHKEITYSGFRSNQDAHSHETFWVVRKVNQVSSVERFKENPIKTSYDLLWNELRNPAVNSQTLRNTLRRILENYFKILGNRNLDNILAVFEGEDQTICGSLISWVHDGSHYAFDDLYVAMDENSVANYLRVFREIFVKLNNLGHYNMMMGLELHGEITDP